MMLRMFRATVILGLVTCALVTVPVPSFAQQAETGKVTLESKSIAAGIGVNWGDGTLTTADGKQYKFSLQGLDVGSVGVESVRAVGKVYNLKHLEDFSGIYSAAKAAIAVGGGGGVAILENQNGVVITLQAADQGIDFTLGPSGVNIALKKS